MTPKYYRVSDLLSAVISGEWGVEPLSEGSVNIIRTTNFLNNGQINFNNIVNRFVDHKIVSKKKLQSGDVIIEKSGGSPNQPVGRVVYFENPDNDIYLCNNFTSILRADSKISPKYLFYWLFFNHLVKRTLSYQNKTTGIINLQLARYLECEKIPLPSSEEQHRIVKILDLAQSLIEKRKQAISYLDDYINSTFFSMFIFNSEEKNIPLVKLEKLSLKITDGVHAKPKYTVSGVPFISVKNITTTKLLFDDCKFVSLADHQNFTKRCKAEFNDILYTKVGATYGRACTVDTKKEFSLYVSVSLIKPNKDLIDPAYLKAVLNSSYVKRQADKSVKGAGVPDLHLIEIKKFKIPLPQMEHQKKFAKLILEVDSLKQKMQTQLEELENNFQAQIQRAFRGE